MKLNKVFTKYNIVKVSESYGVYIFLNNEKVIIYIGKANNLKSRLKSYISKGVFGKTKAMVDNVKYFRLIKTESEIESLILESLLIKRHLPKYNIQLKDDKNYLYVKITDEKYPRIISAKKNDNRVKYKYVFGPFPSSNQTKILLKTIRKIIPYSTHKPKKSICIENQIGLCNPCPSYIENVKDKIVKNKLHLEYKNNIKKVVSIFSGNISKIKKGLIKDIFYNSNVENYEKALELRKRLYSYEYIAEKKFKVSEFLNNPNFIDDIKNEQLKDLYKLLNIKANINRIECFDIAHISGSYTTASMVTFIEGFPEKRYYRQFKIIHSRKSDDSSAMKEVAERRLKHIGDWGKPGVILVDGGISQIKQFQNVFNIENIIIIGFEKRSENLVIPNNILKIKYEKYHLSNRPAKNLVLNLISEAHRFSRKYHHELIKKSIFNN